MRERKWSEIFFILFGVLFQPRYLFFFKSHQIFVRHSLALQFIFQAIRDIWFFLKESCNGLQLPFSPHLLVFQMTFCSSQSFSCFKKNNSGDQMSIEIPTNHTHAHDVKRVLFFSSKCFSIPHMFILPNLGNFPQFLCYSQGGREEYDQKRIWGSS